MNQFETRNNEILVKTKPLFASTWLALFKGLRKSYNERRPVKPSSTEISPAIKKTNTARN
ncbi:MAG: hypothetical protein QNL03_08545 [Gammaproteobacteria bacterium]|nr:hypothetical protein [Gammaproteobacteria bacterium]